MSVSICMVKKYTCGCWENGPVNKMLVTQTIGPDFRFAVDT